MLVAAAVGFALLSLTTATSAATPTSPDPSQYLSPKAAAALQKDQALVSSIRWQMKGGFVSKTKAVLQADGSTVPEVTLQAPSSKAWDAVEKLPQPLQEPVAGLASAVWQAQELLGGTLPEDQVKQGQAAIASLLKQGASAMSDCLRLKKSADECKANLPPMPSFGPAVEHAMQQSPAASLVVASALDTYLPALEAGAQQVPSQAGQVTPACDLLNDTPYLCVGSDGDSTYTDNEVLLIDLGGDDTYRNTAGGAPFPDPSNPLGRLPISINLDLGGNDTYTSHGIVQGAAQLGAVGELIQLNGNATFDVGGPGCGEDCGNGGSVAQGTALGGVGLLFNGGSGNFSATGEIAPLAQGVGILGVGAIVSTGLSDDTYTVTGPLGSPTIAQGAAWAGVGLIFDDGGRDDFHVSVSADTPPDLPCLFGYCPQSLYLGSLQAQAFSNFLGAGMGLLIEGAGSHSYTTEVDGTGAGFAEVYAQAYEDGFGQSTAVLDDAGGPNTYLIKVRQDTDLEIPIDDSCNCARAVASVGPQAGYHVFGQALSAFSEEGVAHAALIDEAGDASFTVDAKASLSVHLADHLTQPESAPNLTVIHGTFGNVSAQGDTSWAGDAAILLTTTGRHSFHLSAENQVDAVATSDHASGTPVAVAIQDPPYLTGQGTSSIAVGTFGNGEGALLDLGGDEPRIQASQDVVVHTAPTEWGALVVGGGAQDVQGEFGTLAALGLSPHIVAHPASPDWPAGQHHGYGVWGVGGVAPLALGAAPTLKVTSAPPWINPDDGSWPFPPVNAKASNPVPRIPVTAQLLDPNGAPIVGATLHFLFEATQPPGGVLGGVLGGPVVPVWQEDAVTDTSGNAAVDLPAWGTKYVSGLGYGFQVTVGFDGADGLYPQWATKPIALNEPPVAHLTATPTSGAAPLDVSLDGGGSSDPDQGDSVASYTFDFGDGTSPVTQDKPTISHAYQRAGKYEASLTVTDNRGVKSEQTAKVAITVLPAPVCFEDDDPHIAYDSGWHTIQDADASAGHFRFLQAKKSQHGLTFSFETQADQGSLQYVYASSTNGGSADLYVDGQLARTLSYQGNQGSLRTPVFGSAAELPLRGTGTHIFELRNVNGAAFVDKLCVTQGNSSAQPSAGPGTTTTNSSTIAAEGRLQ
jgi:PKD repeat protein